MRNKKTVIIAAAEAVFMLLLVFLFHPRFETNDDFGMLCIVSGLHGKCDPHMIYSNILIGKLLCALYAAASDINWYVLFHFLVIYISGVLVTRVLCAKDDPVYLILPVVFNIFFLADAVINLQFTKTAGIDWTPAFFADLLRRIIDAQHHDTIATLDSFILRIVRSFPLEMGFQKDVSVLDDYGKDKAVEKAVEQVLSETSEGRDFIDAFLQAQENDAVRSGRSKVQDAAKAWGRFLRELAMKVKREGREGEPEWTADTMRAALGIEVDSPMPDLSAVPVTGRFGKKGQPLDLPDKVVAKLVDFAEGNVEYGGLFENQPGDCMGHLLENPQATSFTPPPTQSGNAPKTTEFGKEGADAIRAAIRWAAGRELSKKIDIVVAQMRLAKAVERAYDAATRSKGLISS
mgnify:CR=1 FL=1